MRNKFQNK